MFVATLHDGFGVELSRVEFGAGAFEVVKCLVAYVNEDDTDVSMPSNGFYTYTKLKACDAILAYLPKLSTEQEHVVRSVCLAGSPWYAMVGDCNLRYIFMEWDGLSPFPGLGALGPNPDKDLEGRVALQRDWSDTED